MGWGLRIRGFGPCRAKFMGSGFGLDQWVEFRGFRAKCLEDVIEVAVIMIIMVKRLVRFEPSVMC